jgi:lactoylglutathione lyase
MESAIRKYEHGLQHIGIPCSSMEETIAYYEKLGFEIKYRTSTNGQPVCFLRLDDLMIEAYQESPVAQRDGAINHFSIDVSDIEAAFTEAKKMGLALCDDHVNFLPFWENGVRFFTVTGPDMERIEFCQKL